MLVRLKKRGEWPHKDIRGAAKKVEGLGINLFRGCCIEVEPPSGVPSGYCDTKMFLVTDTRLASLYVSPIAICEHYLIDDLNAFETDEVEVGDYMNVSAHK